MQRTRFDRAPCPIARTSDLIGDGWTPLILREAYRGVRRFEDLQAALDIPRASLTTRLDRLVDEGMLRREPYQDHPPRHEYRLTEKGLDLWPVLVALQAWVEKHAPAQSGPPIELTHTACGHRTVPQLACSHCGEPLGPRDVTAARELASSAEFAAAARA